MQCLILQRKSTYFVPFFSARRPIFSNVRWKLPFQVNQGYCQPTCILRLLEVLRGAFLLVVELPENISGQNVGFGVMSSLWTTFSLQSINDNKSAAVFKVFKVSFTGVKQDSHLTMSSPLLQPSTPALDRPMQSWYVAILKEGTWNLLPPKNPPHLPPPTPSPFPRDK